MATLRYAALLVAIAIMPTALAAGSYAAIGQWSAFRFANFVSIFERGADPVRELAGNAARIALLISPPATLAIIALRRLSPSPTRTFIICWLAVATASLIVFRPWFDHYALPLLPPLTAAAAGVLGQASWRRRRTPALLLAVALVGQIVMVALIRERGDAAGLAVAARSVGSGPGCLYVYSGEVMLHVASGRCAPSRYVAPSHLSRTREFGATGTDQDAEIARILASRPAVITMRPPYRGERPAARALVTAAVARSYRLVASVPLGTQPLAIYRRIR